jgi:beta-glucosidase-like glycosyl hydrolase
MLTHCSDWEGFGSDPVLQAFGGSLTVEGIQSVGVIATIKHLIGNEQETYRMYSLVKPGISSNMDDRTLHELYLWPFAEGVRSGVGSVMIAYNAVSLPFGLQQTPLNRKGQWISVCPEQLSDQRHLERRTRLPGICND